MVLLSNPLFNRIVFCTYSVAGKNKLYINVVSINIYIDTSKINNTKAGCYYYYLSGIIKRPYLSLVFFNKVSTLNLVFVDVFSNV